MCPCTWYSDYVLRHVRLLEAHACQAGRGRARLRRRIPLPGTAAAAARLRGCERRSSLGIWSERDSLPALYAGAQFFLQEPFCPSKWLNTGSRGGGLWLGKVEDSGFYGCFCHE